MKLTLDNCADIQILDGGCLRLETPGLSEGQRRTLAAVALMQARGELASCQHIAEFIGTTKMNIHRHIDLLSLKGWVRFGPSSTGKYRGYGAIEIIKPLVWREIGPADAN